MHLIASQEIFVECEFFSGYSYPVAGLVIYDCATVLSQNKTGCKK
jgi:hypothetical protein